MCKIKEESNGGTCPQVQNFSVYSCPSPLGPYMVDLSLSLLPTSGQENRSSEHGQSSYLSQISQIIYVEKNLSCGEISDFYKECEQLIEFLSKFMPFFVQICVEKNLAQKCVCGEKMTNMRSEAAANDTPNLQSKV